MVALLFLATAASPSQMPPRPEFEVASIRPDNGSSPPSTGVGLGRSVSQNVTLKNLIVLAYRVQEFQISGGPSWIGSDRFDVDAKAEDPKADPDQVRRMLQSLLEDRFKLKLQRETKETSIFVLVVGKDGPKMTLSADQASPTVNGPAPSGAGPNRGSIRFGAGSLIGNAVTIALFTRMLSQRLDRTIVDKTNLTSRYDFQLQWSPDAGEATLDPFGNPLPRAADASGVSIFAAMQEQLGLKLESQKGPVEMFVIDHVEKPSPNSKRSGTVPDLREVRDSISVRKIPEGA
jgi:uncharacterized protein (TIGR03435 family)